MAEAILIRIIANDSQAVQTLRRRVVGRGFEVETFYAIDGALDAPPITGRGCLLFAPSVPDCGAAEGVRRLAHDQALPVVVVCRDCSTRGAVEIMRAGAAEYIEHDVCDDEFVERVLGAIDYESSHSARRAKQVHARRLLDQLTPREREVASLVVEGLTNREIGERIGISVKTVEVHRARAMRKMDAGGLARFVSVMLLSQQDGYAD